MSARVFNSHMSEMRRVMRGGGHFDLSESDVRSPPDNSSLERVKRCLFGEVNHNECQLYVQQELESHREDASNKWNFDFRTGRPRPKAEGCVYEWKTLETNETVPEAYAFARLPYLNQHADIGGTTINSNSESSQSVSSSNSPVTLSPKSTKCNKQMKITDFMRKQKTVRGIPPAPLKSEPSTSAKEEEPPQKKSRACSS